MHTLKMGVAGALVLATAGGLTAGCLDRPVAPAKPRTSNVVVKTVTQSGVDKIDLLFMIDNSISMADKQKILADAVPVLVQRLVDPICVDGDGNPVQKGNNGCPQGSSAEFKAIQNIHIGIITSSLGAHGGDVCVPNPADMPPRTLNDQAQLVASVRPNAMPALYSYQNQGFLVWDPRAGMNIPTPDPHPGKSMHETDPQTFVADFATHVQAAGERGCGYEASLESWYRFLVDPEPITQIEDRPVNGYSVRGPINQVLLQQRSQFLRPDSLLAIIMLSDENDCSIKDENDSQGWLVGARVNMPRGSDACAHPEDANQYRCCIPCVLLDQPGFTPPQGCSYGGDMACNGSGGHSLAAGEDSTNLRCYQQKRRFGIDLLYPWQRYVEGLKNPRIRLRDGTTEVTNPLYTPGTDGTPARESTLVFLAGIIGVPWQDIATQDSLGGRSLKYITAPEMAFPADAQGNSFGPNRWDVILGDPEVGKAPLDPFMFESVDQRQAGLPNPIPGVQAAITAAAPGDTGNPINGHEQNVMNKDDLQYACTFELGTPVPCTQANLDGCDCNANEEGYNRPLCRYQGTGMDGTQTHAKAYPGTRHLQVLKGFGDNAIVASICPKNPTAQGNPAQDLDYGYNPAVSAIIDRLKEALIATCLPRPLAAEEDGVPCIVVEAFKKDMNGNCGCAAPGRADLNEQTKGVRPAVFEELRAGSLCDGRSGVNCNEYCMCEIQQFTGGDLETCQNAPQDPGGLYGYCYVDPDHGQGADELVKDCPNTQRQIIRFLGTEVPKPKSLAFIACLGGAVGEAPEM